MIVMEMEMGVKRAVLIFLEREKAEMALGMFEVLWMWQILRRRPHFLLPHILGRR